MQHYSCSSIMNRFCLEQLPFPLQQHIIQLLAPALKLRLRQCSKGMMDLVDSMNSITLKLTTQSKLQLLPDLCREQLKSLIIVGFPVMHPPHLGLLPSLTRLVCDLRETADLLRVALDSTTPQLRSLKLCLSPDASVSDPAISSKCMELAQQSWPGVTSVTSLQMDRHCHKLLTYSQPLCSFVGRLASLKSLVLESTKPDTFPVKALRCEIQDEQWQAAVQPLTALTRLSVSFVALSAHQTNTESSGALHQQAAPAGPLACLQQLAVCGCDGLDALDNWALAWVGSCSSLTSLDVAFCSAAEVDFEVLGLLEQLCSLSLHHFSDEVIMSSQLAPLTCCSRLTALRLDSLVLERGHSSADTAATVAGGAGLQSAPAEEAAAALVTAAAAAAGATSPGTTVNAPQLPQLLSLRKLRAGLLCRAPVASLAPQLTQLRDADYDLAALELPGSFLDESPPEGQEALSGLEDVVLLGVNIFALVRHAAYSSLTRLTGLCELHIDMVGNLSESHLSQGGAGLPLLPHLTRLVMTLAVRKGQDLSKTYTTREDALLWQNQTAVRHMRLRGSKLLGGFLVHDDLLQLLACELTQLRCMELVKCNDLCGLQDLRALVNSRAVSHIVVQACTGVTDRDCLLLEEETHGAVTIDYC